MQRRLVLRTVPLLVLGLGGCLGEEASGGFSSGPTDDETDPETEDEDDDVIPDQVEALRAQFEDRGLRVLDARVDEEFIVFDVQTTGDIDEDIRISSGAFATLAERLERDLRVRVQDRGVQRETFEIELEWATLFLQGRMSDNEYLESIDETRTG